MSSWGRGGGCNWKAPGSISGERAGLRRTEMLLVPGSASRAGQDPRKRDEQLNKWAKRFKGGDGKGQTSLIRKEVCT